MLYHQSDDEESLLHEQEPRYVRRQPRRFPRLKMPGESTIVLILLNLSLLGLIIYLISPLLSLLRHNKEMFSAHVTLTGEDRPNTHPSSQIPRILHQTCKNETIPEIWADSQKSCLEAYSDFEYKLWTDETARKFLSDEYPWFLDTWDTYPFPIQRADAIRYFVLHHYGGIYLDMDTVCHKPIPMHQIDNNRTDNSLFQATLPTGITNDIMISTPRHPAFASAISLLPTFHKLTRFWARLQPYAATMISTGPLFISLATADYLYGEPSLPSTAVQVISQTDLKPYITDLQSATWHGTDARVLKWLADKPLIWFTLGTVAVVGGIYLLNKALLLIHRLFSFVIVSAVGFVVKAAKMCLGEWVVAYRLSNKWQPLK